LARAGQATALDPLYSYERFRTDWRRIFARFLQREARLEALPTVHLAPDGGVGDLEAFGAQRRRKVGAA